MRKIRKNGNVLMQNQMDEVLLIELTKYHKYVRLSCNQPFDFPIEDVESIVDILRKVAEKGKI